MQKNNINDLFKDSEFFDKYSQELKSMAQDSKAEQQRTRQLRKIAILKQQSAPTQSQIAERLLDNIMIDYLRTFNLNYTYTVLMRERNLVSDQIVLKSKLIQQLQLTSYYEKDGFGISVIELMLSKLADTTDEKIETSQIGVQVELISKDNTVNNRVLNEIRIAETRKEVEEKEKKHYQKMLAALKQQLTVTLKDDLKKEFDRKNKEIKNQYEKQVQVLKEKNKEVLVNNPKLNPKVEEYLSKIEELQNKNMNLTSTNRQLEKDKLTHNCFSNPKIVDRQTQLKTIKNQTQKKKKQYELALLNLHTSVEDLASKKQKLLQQPKQTDIFVNEIRKNKQNKDHMIEEIYGRMFVLDKRIQALSQDNDSLREQNRQLTCKVKQIDIQKKKGIEQSKQQKETTNINKYAVLKPKSKDVIVGVTQLQLNKFYQPKQHAIDESMSHEDSRQQQQQIDLKKHHRIEVNSIQSEMKLIKNKLRFMVQDFN